MAAQPLLPHRVGGERPGELGGRLAQQGGEGAVLPEDGGPERRILAGDMVLRT